jgi:prolyl-tRNA editing enzyme YbaK/EbsC (Cys-tRNA(Pro) deacylase)
VGSRGRVAEYLSKSGVIFEMRDFGESTKNSALAASALGCTVAEIAKSVVFVGERTAVVIISGDRRIDPEKLAGVIGGTLRIAKPEEVRERTGYPIGGVPPFPHAQGVDVIPDRSLMRFSHVWAAAGTPNSVFRIGTSELVRIVGTRPQDLAE